MLQRMRRTTRTIDTTSRFQLDIIQMSNQDQCDAFLTFVLENYPEQFKVIERLIIQWKNSEKDNKTMTQVIRSIIDQLKLYKEIIDKLDQLLPNHVRIKTNYIAKKGVQNGNEKKVIKTIDGIRIWKSKFKEPISRGQLVLITKFQKESTKNVLSKKKSEVNPPTHKQTEKNLFQRLHQSIGPLFTKCLYLFSLTVMPLYQFIQQLMPYISKADAQSLADSLVDRQTSRLKQTVFRPPKDLQNHQRISYSYIRMPSSYPNICSGQNSLGPRKVINRLYVGVPHSSQLANFNIMTKNQYQQQLFKCQDKMYQIDHFSQLFKTCLQILRNRDKKNPMGEIKAFRAVNHLYGVYSDKFYEGIQKNEERGWQVLERRIQSKLKQIQQIKLSQSSSWKVSYQKNYHKSLDHRSQCFKKNDKRLNNQSRLERQAEFRYLLVTKASLKNYENKDSFQTDVSSFLKIHNSFEGISNVDGFEFSSNTGPINVPQNLKGIPPIFRLNFERRSLVEQLLSMFSFYLNNCSLSYSHAIKQKIKEVFEQISNFFKVRLVQIKDKSAVNLQKILQRAKSIQSLIYDRVSIPDRQQQKDVQQDDEDCQEKKRKVRQKDSKDNQQHDFSSMISESEQPMQFLSDEGETELLPNQVPKSIFSTKYFYFFIRHFYTLYQRFYQALQLSSKFQSVSRVDGLTEGCRQALIGERYEVFKLAILLRLKENSLFQDTLRLIFDQNAFRFSTIDKHFNSAIKALQKMVSDQLSYGLFKESLSRYPDCVIFAKVSKLSNKYLDKQEFKGGLFRISLLDSYDLLINYFDCPYKGWQLRDASPLDQIKRFVVQETDQNLNAVTFNLYDMAEELKENSIKPASFQNGLTLTATTNSSLLRTYRGQDIIQKRRRDGQPGVSLQLNRVRKLRMLCPQ